MITAPIENSTESTRRTLETMGVEILALFSMAVLACAPLSRSKLVNSVFIKAKRLVTVIVQFKVV
jgi:hypothetical protein